MLPAETPLFTQVWPCPLLNLHRSRITLEKNNSPSPSPFTYIMNFSCSASSWLRNPKLFCGFFWETLLCLSCSPSLVLHYHFSLNRPEFLKIHHRGQCTGCSWIVCGFCRAFTVWFLLFIHLLMIFQLSFCSSGSVWTASWVFHRNIYSNTKIFAE